MAVAELHFFHADDPNGSTIFECSTDDAFLKSVRLNIQRDSLGGGTVSFARKVPAGGLFTREIVVPETLVRVLVPEIDATHYLHAFWINPRQQQVVSKDEQGGEGFTFGGPGPKHYLERMVLWSASFDGQDAAVDRDAGIWVWPETAKVGRILSRLIDEDAANPHGPFLPDLTMSFGDVNDSAGVPWVDNISVDEDFTLRINDDYLRILWIIEDAADLVTTVNLGTVSNPLLQLNAYQTFGRDLTEDVLFAEGVNISTDLDVEGISYKKASHALVKGNDGFYNLAVNPAWDPGELKKVVAVEYDSANTATLDRAGIRFLRRQDNGEQQIELKIVPGFDDANGLYMPSPEAWGNGHFWVGDIISLTTGIAPNQTELDYDDEPQDVTGIELELTEAVRDDTALMAARSWDLTVFLNEERKSSSTSRDLAGSRGTVQAPPNILRLCPALTIGGETAARLYFSQDAGAGTETIDADWATDTSPELNLQLRATPGGSASTHANDSVNLAADAYIDAQYSMLVGSGDLLTAVQTGGTFRMQMRGNSRHGIGINEAAQNNRLTICARVIRAGVEVGTAVAVGAQFAVETYPAIPTHTNRALSGAFTAIPSALSTDKLVVEVGWGHFDPISGGTGVSFVIQPTVAAGSDLPEDESTTTDLRAWIEFRSSGAVSGTGQHPDIVGTSTRAKRCDGTEHVQRDRAPGISDNSDLGYPVNTHWRDSVTGIVYWLTDADAGTWEIIWNPDIAVVDALAELTVDVNIDSPAADDDLRFDGDFWINDPRKWEAVTNGEDIFVWESDDLVHEWNEAP